MLLHSRHTLIDFRRYGSLTHRRRITTAGVSEALGWRGAFNACVCERACARVYILLKINTTPTRARSLSSSSSTSSSFTFWWSGTPHNHSTVPSRHDAHTFACRRRRRRGDMASNRRANQCCRPRTRAFAGNRAHTLTVVGAGAAAECRAYFIYTFTTDCRRARRDGACTLRRRRRRRRRRAFGGGG